VSDPYPGEEAFAKLDQEKWLSAVLLDSIVEAVGKYGAGYVIEPSPDLEA